MDILKLTPPFTYSYQCGSTILTSYIPVYMYSSIFQILIDISRVIIIFQINFEDYPQFIYKNIRISKIISNIINNMILLLSFGLSSPVLCLSICLSVIINISCWLMIIGRLIFQSQYFNHDDNYDNNKIRNESEDKIGKI